MKKINDLFSYKGSIILYMVIAPLILYLSTIASLKYSKKVVYSLPDVVCFNEHYAKNYISVILFIMLIYLFKDYFRAGVILRYQTAYKIMLKMIKELLVVGALTAAYQTFWTVMFGIPYVQYQNNWDKVEAAPFFLVGKTVINPLPTHRIIFAYFWSAFFTVLVIGLLICCLWWLTETPVTGYVCMVVLLATETGIREDTHIWFARVDLRPEKVYLDGIGTFDFWIYPLILVIVFFVISIVVIKRHNFLRIK